MSFSSVGNIDEEENHNIYYDLFYRYDIIHVVTEVNTIDIDSDYTNRYFCCYDNGQINYDRSPDYSLFDVKMTELLENMVKTGRVADFSSMIGMYSAYSSMNISQYFSPTYDVVDGIATSNMNAQKLNLRFISIMMFDTTKRQCRLLYRMSRSTDVRFYKPDYAHDMFVCVPFTRA